MGQTEINPGVSHPHGLLESKPGVTSEMHRASFQLELVDTLQN